MAEVTQNISETYEANPTTKQFNLGKSFEAYAKAKGLSEKGIQMSREAIEERFAKYNAEKMDDKRFGNLKGTMEGMIAVEIRMVQNILLSKSEALAGTSAKPQQVASNNTPEIINTPKITNTSIAASVSGGFKDMVAARNKKFADAGI